ncbi:MAG: hypothetical protein GY760_25260 [Deltaproteobacteria bacterium]|nr:hypothetical protein [Deltaproteobacteria bacterium]
MDEKIKHWINVVLEDTDNKSILDKTGADCCKTHGFIERAMKIRDSVNDKNNISELISMFKKKVFSTYDLNMLNDREIFLDYKFSSCICPMVTKGVTDNSALCNCTKGFTTALFSTLLNKEIEVELLETVLKGGKSCKQKITIL